MAENLYTTQTPDSSDNAEDTYTMGTELVFAVDGTITAVRWFSATNAIGTSPNARIYSAAGATLATKAAGVQTPGGVWNTTTFDTPLAVTAGVYYIAAFGPINRYAALGGMHSAADVTNGNITAPRNGVGGHSNGRFVANAATTFPTSSGGSGYFVDVAFEAGAASTVVTGAAALGRVVAAGTVTRTVVVTGTKALGGLSAAATMSPSRTVTGAAALGGLAASVADVEHVRGTGPRAGGWRSLLDIIHDARDTRDREVMAAPVACPNDGEPLQAAPGGGLFCPFDGWRPQ